MTAAVENQGMSIRVLIGDGDRSLADSYREYLEQHGFDVATATTARECVDRLRDYEPNVLVLEPSLPQGLGERVLAAMHEDLGISPIPVIVLSYACMDPGLLYHMSRYRIDDYQVKPLSARRLARRIHDVLGFQEIDQHAGR
jgi:DNA-binding response OmpR family regulator